MPFLIALGLCFALVVYLVANGDRSWYVGALGVVVIGAMLMLPLVYVVHVRRAEERLRRMGEPTATLLLDDRMMRLTSGAGTSELHWKLIREVQIGPVVWLVRLSAAEIFTLPTADLGLEVGAFIRRKVAEHGGTVA